MSAARATAARRQNASSSASSRYLRPLIQMGFGNPNSGLLSQRGKVFGWIPKRFAVLESDMRLAIENRSAFYSAQQSRFPCHTMGIKYRTRINSGIMTKSLVLPEVSLSVGAQGFRR